MQIITSAAYLSGDLKSEFGMIPPSFLPLQNKRLYTHQFALLQQKEEPVFLTLPQSFEIDGFDKAVISKSNVEIIRVPDNLSLCNSILFALNIINKPAEPVLILHGDTLFESLPSNSDSVYVAFAKDNYNWGNVSLDANKDNSEVYAGLFYCSNQQLLANSLNKFSTDFVAAIENYAAAQHLSIEFTNNWMDFGHPNTYFRSKANLTTERVFNNLMIDAYTVKKFSDDTLKMQAEANWFVNVPARIKKYTPNLIAIYQQEKIGYELDYLYLSTLSELFVFGKNDPFVWKNIFKSCNTFLQDCLPLNGEISTQNNANKFSATVINKTVERIQKFSAQHLIDIEKAWNFNGQQMPSLLSITHDTAAYIDDNSIIGFVHGDFCCSNILFDFRKQMLKVIDPRGLDFDRNIAIDGDLRYDIAKLSHSIIGLYDFIIAGRYSLHINQDTNHLALEIFTNDSILQIQEVFKQTSFVEVQVTSKQNYALMIHLFLSMLPLHNDNKNRQFAFMANAYRLYQIFQQL
jgi:hypothetical protein